MQCCADHAGSRPRPEVTAYTYVCNDKEYFFLVVCIYSELLACLNSQCFRHDLLFFTHYLLPGPSIDLFFLKPYNCSTLLIGLLAQLLTIDCTHTHHNYPFTKYYIHPSAQFRSQGMWFEYTGYTYIIPQNS